MFHKEGEGHYFRIALANEMPDVTHDIMVRRIFAAEQAVVGLAAERRLPLSFHVSDEWRTNDDSWALLAKMPDAPNLAKKLAAIPHVEQVQSGPYLGAIERPQEMVRERDEILAAGPSARTMFSIFVDHKGASARRNALGVTPREQRVMEGVHAAARKEGLPLAFWQAAKRVTGELDAETVVTVKKGVRLYLSIGALDHVRLVTLNTNGVGNTDLRPLIGPGPGYGPK